MTTNNITKLILKCGEYWLGKLHEFGRIHLRNRFNIPETETMKFQKKLKSMDTLTAGEFEDNDVPKKWHEEVNLISSNDLYSSIQPLFIF